MYDASKSWLETGDHAAPKCFGATLCGGLLPLFAKRLAPGRRNLLDQLLAAQRAFGDLDQRRTVGDGRRKRSDRKACSRREVQGSCLTGYLIS